MSKSVAALFVAVVLSGCGAGSSTVVQPNGVTESEPGTPAKTWTVVGDEFLLSDLPEDSFAQLIVGRALRLPQPTHRLVARGQAELHPLSVAGGKYLQDVKNGLPCVDVESGSSVDADGCASVVAASDCKAWWTPVAAPSDEEAGQEGEKSKSEGATAAWEVSANQVFPIKRAEFSSSLFLHADHARMYENQFSLSCKGVPSETLTVGHLKKAFGADVVVKVLR